MNALQYAMDSTVMSVFELPHWVAAKLRNFLAWGCAWLAGAHPAAPQALKIRRSAAVSSVARLSES